MRVLVIFLAIWSTVPAEKVNPDNIAPSLLVTHYDCENPLAADTYSVNEVPSCQLKPENIDVAEAVATLYQVAPIREISAHRCTLSYQVITWYCGMHSHSSMSYNTANIVREYALSVQDCELARSTGEMKVTFPSWVPTDKDWDGTRVQFKMDTKHTQVLNFGQKAEDKKWQGDCNEYGNIYHYTFTSLITTVKLNYNIEDDTILGYYGKQLPCKFSDGGCEGSLLDPAVYSWNATEECVLAELRTIPVKMVKYNDRYFMLSQEENTELRKELNATLDFKIEVFKESELKCGRTDQYRVHKTNLYSLFVKWVEGFDIFTGKNLRPLVEANPLGYGTRQDKLTEQKAKQKYSKQMVQSIRDRNAQASANQKGQAVPNHKLDYDMHTNAKFDYVLFKAISTLRAAEINLLTRDCEIERTQILTILTLSLINDRMAGYLLTGNRSNFLETDGTIAWLYTCKEHHSPLLIEKKCYDKIPVDYMGVKRFVDPITRQTFNFASEVQCDGGPDNVFHLNLKDENSWYNLLPFPVRHDPPKFFRPHAISHITPFETYSVAQAGLYSQADIKQFWNRIIQGRFTDEVLKTFAESVGKTGHGHPGPNDPTSGIFGPDLPQYKNPADIFVDTFISPDFFKNQFIANFGYIAFYLQLAGTYFAAFLLVKFLLEIVMSIIRAFEIHVLAGRTVSFARLVAAAMFNVFYVTALTNIFARRANEGDEHRNIPDVDGNCENSQLTNFLYPDVRDERHPPTAPVEMRPLVAEERPLVR